MVTHSHDTCALHTRIHSPRGQHLQLTPDAVTQILTICARYKLGLQQCRGIANAECNALAKV